MRFHAPPVFFLAVTALAAQSLQRQGSYWVETSTGSAAVPPASVLKIYTNGNIALRATSGNTISYKVSKRVAARSEGEARRLAAQLQTQFSQLQPQGIPLTSLVVLHPAHIPAMADLEIRVPQTWREVLVKSESGDVEVYDLQTTLRAQSGGGGIRLDRHAGEVWARTGGGEIQIGSVQGPVHTLSSGGSIRVQQTSGPAWFETSGGEIYIGECGGPIQASTAGGNISVGRAGSTVDARTAGGLIEIKEAAGTVTAENSGGAILVAAAPKGVRAETSGGAIRLAGAAGALRAISDIGNIQAFLKPGARIEDSVLSTGSGDIVVFLPSNLAVTVKAQIESGRPDRIISEFREIVLSRSLAMAEGMLNGGGPVLRLSVVNGTIYLRRAK